MLGAAGEEPEKERDSRELAGVGGRETAGDGEQG